MTNRKNIYIWYVDMLRIILTLPFSLLYGLIIVIRNKLFDIGFFRSTQFNLPVISVGNLVAGGTGKTPHIEYLIRLLNKQHHIATLSRGYLRKTKGFVLAQKGCTAATIGDEPLQYFQKFKHILVAVDEKRRRGIRQLLKLHKKPDVILLDDAFQHRSVKPGLSILLTDFHNIYTNNYMLPTGTLREPRSGARRADVIIVTKTPLVLSPLTRRQLTDELAPLPHQKLFFSYIHYDHMLPVLPQTPLPTNKQFSTILLFAGIANTYPLEEHLTKFCNNLITINFADHHAYTEKDILKIKTEFESIFSKNKIIITTEKDAMRLGDDKLVPLIGDLPLFYVPIKVSLHDNDQQLFIQFVQNYVKANQRNR